MTQEEHWATVTRRIKGAMAEAGYTQHRTADALGVSYATMSRWVNHPGRMTIDYWVRLCKVLGMDINDLTRRK